MAVKNKMKAIRYYMGMTQEQFAEQLGVTAATISYIEQGKRNMSGRLAARLTRLEMGLPDDFYFFAEKLKCNITAS